MEKLIEVKDLKKYYNGGEVKALDGISVDICKGDVIAVIGPSGGGKSTICNIIPRFYEIEGGRVTIDGRDIRTLTLDSLRRGVGIVSQDVFLFDSTVRDNITYGAGEVSEDELITAAKRANIHDYIMTLPDGYDTQVGERGVKLSGGQKQRIAIARVFLKNPKILILDEATSALDNATEKLITESLDALCVGRTTIVVAHRLSTVKHDELMAQNGIYKELYEYQFRT